MLLMKFMHHVDTLRKLFKHVKFSEAGSNARQREENTYMYFLEYLDGCEKGERYGALYCQL